MPLKHIKEEALKQFAENGYEGTSIKDITKVIGVTAPSLYAHFNSKEELFIEILKECLTELTGGIEKTIELNKDECELKKLCGIFEYYLNFFNEHNSKAILVLRNEFFPPSELKDTVRCLFSSTNKKVYESVDNIFANCLEKDIIKKWTLEKHVNSFYRLINSYVFEIMAFNKVLIREDMDNIWEYYWNFIKN